MCNKIKEAYQKYIDVLRKDGVNDEEIRKHIKEPFSRSVPVKHRQIYSNLNSLLMCDLMTTISMSGCRDLTIDEINQYRNECKMDIGL
jgi:hypothetical protein